MCETRWSVTTDQATDSSGFARPHSASLTGGCWIADRDGDILCRPLVMWSRRDKGHLPVSVCVGLRTYLCSYKFMCGVPVSMMQVNGELPVTRDVWTCPIMLTVVSTVPEKFCFPGFEKIQDDWWSSGWPTQSDFLFVWLERPQLWWCVALSGFYQSR